MEDYKYEARYLIEVIDIKYLDYEEYLNKRVKIKDISKSSYGEEMIGCYGIVDRTSNGEIGVLVDGFTNTASSYGCFWFKRSEIKIIEERNMLEGYKFVAIVNIPGDYNHKDYAFALYDEDMPLVYVDGLVVVNPREENNRTLAIVKEILPVEDYKGAKVTKQVVGTVRLDNYLARKEEEKRLSELNKKKATLKKKIDDEIKKKKDIEFYKQMADQYPELAAMVKELESLGE